jgi:DUF1365 family protein
MKSAIYTGTIHHRRVAPKFHDFRYQVALFYLDLSEITQIFKWPFLFSARGLKLMGFDRQDYLKGSANLTQAVQNLIFKETSKTHRGPIRLLTQIRYFGFCFNPVSFYYCFNESDTELEFIVAEITNTPWNERQAYVLDCQGGGEWNQFEFRKNFHVSPFLPMDLWYVWRFARPHPENKDSLLTVRMEDWNLTKTLRIFDASLILQPKALTSASLVKTVLTYPLLTLKTGIAIYYQALCLKLKNIPFYSHPEPRRKS